MPSMSRRVWAVLLGLFLVAFLFEGAVHSVHHIDSEAEATACWVAGAAGSLSLVSPDTIVLDDPGPPVIGSPVTRGVRAPALRPLDVMRGRAPPPVLSA